ncbi:MAG: hypothetical protein Q9166_000569 [cf. Caloplaca sp. 2 TL-2023]
MRSLVLKIVMLLGILFLHGSAFASNLVSATNALFTPGRVHQELGRQLSKNASICFPNSPQFGNLNDRWSNFSEGNIAIVVEAAVSQDVAAAVRKPNVMHISTNQISIQVKFANRCGLPFLAVNSGHGITTALRTIQQGVSINLRKLNKIQIAQDGNSALMGGGVNTHEVVNTLAASGKVTATTNGGCTGLLGPGLGGGFGRYMGFFGLILDNVVDMTVVLGNGTIITVSSTSHPDLYWGMKGAGQNFGIVTEANFRIHDFPTPNWFHIEIDLAGSQLETLFQHINKIDQPKELGSVYTVFAMNAKYSTTDPIMTLQFSYAGTPKEAQPSFNLFSALQPEAVRINESVSPTEIQAAANQDIDSGICQHGRTWRLFPLGLKKYNIDANREVYNLFKQLVAEHPQFNGSIVQFENYARQGMRAVDPDSTAYPHRDDDILVSFAPIYPPSTANDAIASDFGNKARAIWHAGDTPGRNVTAYLNYANGDETLEARYGYESWRLERLRGLKKQYDPNNKFRFYNPIS